MQLNRQYPIYRLLGIAMVMLFCYQASAQVTVALDEQGALFMENGDSVMYYRAAEMSLDGAYPRANFIHPLYSLDGVVLTENFPEDHVHQRGVFWAWHQLYIGDRRIGDGWHLKDIHWDVTGMKLERGNSLSAVLTTEVDWKSPLRTDPDGNQMPIIKESTTMEVVPSEDDHRVIAIRIELAPQYDNVRLGCSDDEKGYGGFSVRMRLPDGMIFTSQDGPVTPQNLPLSAGPWMDISGPIGKNASKAGITIVGDPRNPGFPDPWILRQKASMQSNPYPGREPVLLSREDPLVLRYRLIVHDELGEDRLLEIASD